MIPYDQRRTRSIDTPFGPHEITEKKWNEGEDDEHWAYVQSLNPEFPQHRRKCDTTTGEVVGHFFTQYAIARELANEGYELHSQLDGESLLWVNYTES